MGELPERITARLTSSDEDCLPDALTSHPRKSRKSTLRRHADRLTASASDSEARVKKKNSELVTSMLELGAKAGRMEELARRLNQQLTAAQTKLANARTVNLLLLAVRDDALAERDAALARVAELEGTIPGKRKFKRRKREGRRRK